MFCQCAVVGVFNDSSRSNQAELGIYNKSNELQINTFSANKERLFFLLLYHA